MDDKDTPTQGYNLTTNQKRLMAFVVNHTDTWRTYRDENYLDTWNEYERLWRGLWTGSDKNRDSERSRIVTPAIRQAIDSRQAEIEEAIFGRKDWFDVDDDVNDKDPADIALLRRIFVKTSKKTRLRRQSHRLISLVRSMAPALVS